jgi:hypothetical protein
VLAVFCAAFASDVTVSASFFSPSAPLLQATITEAIARIAKNFFIVLWFFKIGFKINGAKVIAGLKFSNSLTGFFYARKSPLVSVIFS